jgi:hypothetical protein
MVPLVVVHAHYLDNGRHLCVAGVAAVVAGIPRLWDAPRGQMAVGDPRACRGIGGGCGCSNSSCRIYYKEYIVLCTRARSGRFCDHNYVITIDNCQTRPTARDSTTLEHTAYTLIILAQPFQCMARGNLTSDSIQELFDLN